MGHSNAERETKRKAEREAVEAFADWLRFRSQSILGGVIFICLLGRVIWRFRILPEPAILAACPYASTVVNRLQTFFSQSTLGIVADGLAISAGIDLAFMLTTEGPDEAIVPLITGLASAVLLIVANEKYLGLHRILGISVLILLIAFLYNFAEKKKLLKKPDNPNSH